MDYDLIFYVASWPAVRTSAWDALLPARAIENLAYSVGLNRVGIDGNQISYVGHSVVYDFKGERFVGFGRKGTDFPLLSWIKLTWIAIAKNFQHGQMRITLSCFKLFFDFSLNSTIGI